MRNVLLILSSGYCNPELQSEFGTIPSALVPVGNKTLLELQVEHVGYDIQDEDIFVTLPNDWVESTPMPYNVIQVDPNKSVDDAYQIGISEVFSRVQGEHVHVHVLWGDTLVTERAGSPCMGVSAPRDGFQWTPVVLDYVFNGYLVLDEETARRYIDSDPPKGVSEYHTLKYLTQNMGIRRYHSGWYDFGHGTTYWKSKAQFFSTRHFNTTEVVGNRVRKTGEARKIQAELNWYRRVPAEVRMYCPQVQKASANSYLMEYLPAPSLAEIYVFGMKDMSWWQNVLTQILDFVSICSKKEPGPSTVVYDHMFLSKAYTRHQESPWYSTYQQLAITHMNYLSRLSTKVSVIHGDLCFSNVLYDSRSDSIKVIDPRGLNSVGKESIYGSFLYDLAKIYHSLFGGYDFIVAGRPFKRNPKLINWFEREVERRFSIGTQPLRILTGLLFTTMVPLHIEESRERARRLHERGIDIIRNSLR